MTQHLNLVVHQKVMANFVTSMYMYLFASDKTTDLPKTNVMCIKIIKRQGKNLFLLRGLAKG